MVAALVCLAWSAARAAAQKRPVAVAAALRRQRRHLLRHRQLRQALLSAFAWTRLKTGTSPPCRDPAPPAPLAELLPLPPPSAQALARAAWALVRVERDPRALLLCDEPPAHSLSAVALGLVSVARQLLRQRQSLPHQQAPLAWARASFLGKAWAAEALPLDWLHPLPARATCCWSALRRRGRALNLRRGCAPSLPAVCVDLIVLAGDRFLARRSRTRSLSQLRLLLRLRVRARASRRLLLLLRAHQAMAAEALLGPAAHQVLGMYRPCQTSCRTRTRISTPWGWDTALPRHLRA